MQNFDLLVIGAGSAGVRAARTAAATGAKVAIAEYQQLGGTCVNVGCIPKKLYSFAGHYSADFADAAGFGWKLGTVTFNWAVLRGNKQKEIQRLNVIYETLLQKAGVVLLKGKATMVDPATVVINGERYQARHILVCTGGRPEMPDFPGHELALTSAQIFDLPRFPERLLIIGAGYIGVEFASIFAGLGTKTWLSWRSELPLRGFDEDVRKFFKQELAKNCQLLPSTQLQEIKRLPYGSLQASFDNDSRLEVDQILIATGRIANVQGLGLENTRVELASDGTIKVDASYRTAEPTIYAIGDVVGHKALTPVALAEAMWVIDHLFGGRQRQPLNYHNVATAVFAHPTVATVGLSESQARQFGYHELAIYETDFRHLRHTLSGRDERTYLKVVVDVHTDKVLGMHMVGAEAGEIIQGFAAALTAGITKSQLDATIGIHPTAAEEFVTLRTRSR